MAIDFLTFALYRYLKDLVEKCGVEIEMGLVQTAYANGASTDYIMNQLVNLRTPPFLRSD